MRRTSSQIVRREAGSSPVVGSSRKSTVGECTSALARSSLRFIPPEYVFVRRSAASVSPTSWSSSDARVRAARPWIPYSPHCSSSSSRPVWTGSRPISCSATPIRRRTEAPSVATSKPATNARPEVGGSSVHSIRTVVVLPAPLGPRKPKTSPAETVRSIPFTASIPPPKLRHSSRASMAGPTALIAPLPCMNRTCVCMLTEDADERVPAHLDSRHGSPDRHAHAARSPGLPATGRPHSARLLLGRHFVYTKQLLEAEGH